MGETIARRTIRKLLLDVKHAARIARAEHLRLYRAPVSEILASLIASGMTQYGIAKALNVPQSSISKHLHCLTTPRKKETVQCLIRLAKERNVKLPPLNGWQARLQPPTRRR